MLVILTFFFINLGLSFISMVSKQCTTKLLLTVLIVVTNNKQLQHKEICKSYIHKFISHNETNFFSLVLTNQSSSAHY